VRAFVTGATGFVGSHLVHALLERGDRVTALVRSPSKAAKLLDDRVDVVVGTLEDAKALTAGCEDADLIFHAAALTAARSRREFFAVNGQCTAELLDIAARVAPNLSRFVYVSSLSAAGPCARGRRRSETEPPQPVSHYGASKLAGEDHTRASQVPWTIVRPSAVYGPRDTEMLRVFQWAARGFAPTFGDAGQEVTMVYVSDLVGALLAVTHPAAEGRTYFAAHPEVVTTRELVGLIGTATARPGAQPRRTRVVRVPSGLGRVLLTAIGWAAWTVGVRTLLSRDKANELLADAWTCTTDAIERDVGWRASVPLREGLAHTAEWYRDAGWL
jgi:nucleoside-diphosphate-sugar epimerase